DSELYRAAGQGRERGLLGIRGCPEGLIRAYTKRKNVGAAKILVLQETVRKEQWRGRRDVKVISKDCRRLPVPGAPLFFHISSLPWVSGKRSLPRLVATFCFPVR